MQNLLNIVYSESTSRLYVYNVKLPSFNINNNVTVCLDLAKVEDYKETDCKHYYIGNTVIKTILSFVVGGLRCLASFNR